MKHSEVLDSALVNPRLIQTLSRSEGFSSLYFDHQHAYKYLFELENGNRLETSLYIHVKRGEVVDIAVDIATLIGCPIGCQFCAATIGKYIRPLTAGEMFSQFTRALEISDLPIYPKVIAAFQGIGEPRLVAHEVLRASKLIRDLDRRNVVSISTTGVGLAGIRTWREAELPISVLQFSLTATSNSSQKHLIPKAPEFNALLEEIVLCSECSNIEVVNVNYVLVRDINDSAEHIDFIVRHFAGTAVRFRVASLNSTASSRRFGLLQASKDEATAFAKCLSDRGVNVSVFGAFNDTTVSCGQLAFAR